MPYQLNKFPPCVNLDTVEILNKLGDARDSLAELRGVCKIIPNQNILLSTLPLQEAKDSSAIENIITTQDDLYRSDTLTQNFTSPAAKEVHSYADALRAGYDMVQQTRLLTCNHILQIQSILEKNDAGFRKIPGTALRNDQTGEIVYEPPQDGQIVAQLMGDLEHFINEDSPTSWHPLIKMTILHHQFESIHPFYDGNGRTGRILNILYLVKHGLLHTPVLYLSRYINKNKNDYYRLLQQVRDTGQWNEWVLFMLTGVDQTAKQTSRLIESIHDLMLHHKHQIRENRPKIYSQDLLNTIFSHPYSKIEFLVRDLGISRITAANYLDAIETIGLMKKVKVGRTSYYLNLQLFDLLGNAGTL